MKETVPYKDIVKKNTTLAEFGSVDFGNGYSLKVRVKSFILLNKAGEEYERGPCISWQLFHNGRFLKAVSLPNGKEKEVLAVTEKACNWVANHL